MEYSEPELGLQELSDDQLVRLLNEACIELAVRDPTVRTLAQGCITGMAELLPEIRRWVKDLVESVNDRALEDEGDEDHPPRRNPRNRRRKHNPSVGSTMPGSFTVPQNPTFITTIEITVPPGYGWGTGGAASLLQDTLKKILGRGIGVNATANSYVFHANITDVEYKLIAGHNLLAAYHIAII